MEKEVRNEEQLKALMTEESEKIMKEYDDLFEELEKGDYFTKSYADDSVVMVPGKLFMSFVNFVNSQLQTLYSVQKSNQVLLNTGDAMITNVSQMTVQLMKQHKANVDNGVTITKEEMDALDAKKKVVEVVKPVTKKKKTAKAVGTKS